MSRVAAGTIGPITEAEKNLLCVRLWCNSAPQYMKWLTPVY